MSILEILLAYQSRPNDRVWSGCVYPQDAATGNPYKFSLCLPIESQSAMLVKFSANVADLSTSEGRSERGWDFKLSIGVNCDFIFRNVNWGRRTILSHQTGKCG